MNEQQKIGKIIKEAREKKGLSQGKLAKLLEVQNPVIYKYEKGLIKVIPFEKRIKISEILNINLEELLYMQEVVKSIKMFLGANYPDWKARNFISLDGDDDTTLLLESIANKIKKLPLIEAIKEITLELKNNKIIDKQLKYEFFNLLLYERGLSNEDRESLANYCAEL